MGKKKTRRNPKKKIKRINLEQTKKLKIKKKHEEKIKLYPIEEEKLNEFKHSFKDNIYNFEMDSEELYENNVFPSFQKENKESPVIIDKEFYKNIPLNDIKNLKKLLKALKNIHTFGINYDFINSKELIDKYLNIDYGNNEIDNFINNEVEEDFDNEEEEQEGGDSLENEMFSINKENISKSIDLDENNEKEN